MDNDEYQYLDIDFSPLLVPNVKFAVRCESEEEARAFVKAMEDRYPAKCRYITSEDVRWNNDLDGQYGGRAYYPDINNVEDDHLCTGDIQFAKDHNYTIVKFSDLLIYHVQIEESDIPISTLFE